ncbi:hypothetical protein H5187_23545 [Pseudoalteromonas sp. SG44-1]|uniref:hypothetical protein n=1 Tax=unclassified Pseudoalteromonas TaxID=194690 RepID=UPI0016025149|nr:MULTISPECIES: hypothetical protein [unclassified Pseudoalteromonas]MBB1420186.1 hypothetical protein [Pseudoalteromonas sp. SG44-1]MBB1482182.1 hypothetical protein [Pseudoalteromonas sp. SG41-2]
MNNKLSTSEKGLYRRVDEILFYLWDPIGVCDIPMARDEYQSYLPKVFKLLLNDPKEHEVSAYLIKVETGSMGMSANSKKALEVARILIETKEALLE